MAREYKDSGIEWIGKIPKEWEVVKLRNLGSFSASGIDKKIVEGEELVHIVNYVDVYNNNTKELRVGDYMVVSAPLDKCQEHQLCVGDMIYTPSSETIEDIGLSSVVMDELPNTAYSYHVIRFRTNDEIYLKYKKYLTNNHVCLNYFSSCATGSIRKTLSREIFKECKVLLPPLSAQQKIADYLDKVCGEVDELISLQETMIEELKAYKQSVITEAVTKGLNPDVKMKDSGIEWIGEVPEHWEVKPLKRIVKRQLQYGANESGVTYDIRLPRYVRITDILDNNLREDITKLSLTEEQADEFILENDDILFARSGGTVGKAFIYKKKYGRCAFAGYLIRAQIKDNCSDFIFYFTQSYPYEEWKRRIFIQATIQNIGADRYSLLEIPIPPLSEQQSIASYLDAKCAEIDDLIAIKQAKIEELKEYKKSVIYEYVTGKKEVIV